jgi:hypothetical protein
MKIHCGIVYIHIKLQIQLLQRSLMQQQIGLKNERKTVANEYSTKANSQGLSKLSDIHKRNQIPLKYNPTCFTGCYFLYNNLLNGKASSNLDFNSDLNIK